MTEGQSDGFAPFSAGRLRGAVGEVVIISLGILLAFGVDAWWEGAQDRQELAESLSALEAELQLNREAVARSIPQHENSAAIGFELLSTTGPESASEGLSRVMEVLPRFMYNPTSGVSSGSLNALLASGQVSEIDDPELRGGLAALPAALADQAAVEAEIARLMREVVFPRIWLHVPQLDAEVAGGFGGGELLDEFRARAPTRSQFNGDFASLLRDLQFENAVVERTTYSLVARQGAASLDEELGRVLRLLRASRN